MEKVTTIGLDLAKSVFQVHGVDGRGQAVVRKQLRRSQVSLYFAKLPPCVVGMEACGGAHYWARQLQALGHDVKLIPPQYVKPYVKTNKTDAADAEAISEAVQRPGMRFVPIKTVDQQTILSIHRARQGLVRTRTATMNHIRGLLTEYGLVLPNGPRNLAKIHQAMIGHELPEIFQQLIELQLGFLRELENRIDQLEKQIELWHRDNEASQRLMAIPGVGILTATAMVASVGDGRQFANARHLAAWIGLTPRQSSSGGKPRLLGISKRGDVYLRTLLIHGGRSVLRSAEGRPNAEHAWSIKLMRRRNKNIAAVAVAHKNARTIWALLTKHQVFDPQQRASMPVAA